MINVTGPSHGAPGIVANTYLESTYSELYPNVSQDERRLSVLCQSWGNSLPKRKTQSSLPR